MHGRWVTFVNCFEKLCEILSHMCCTGYVILDNAKCSSFTRQVQENCWLFASFLQQCLGSSGRGMFVFGDLPLPRWALQLRLVLEHRIQQLYRLNEAPLSVSS